MGKKILQILVVVIIILAVIIIYARLQTPEDNWLCVNGQWVKHGNPSASQPTSSCTINNNEINTNQDIIITDFETCAAAGNPIMESYPRRCAVNGQTFTERIDGIDCAQSSECELPGEWAIKAYCPYLAKCYQAKCNVICPLFKDKTNSAKMTCKADSDCDCSGIDDQHVFTCACVEGQCATIIQELTSGNEIIDTSSRMDLEYYAAECAKAKGKWLAPYAECENVNEQWCQKEQGIFNECASACRNQVEATICTMQCIPVCLFNLL